MPAATPVVTPARVAQAAAALLILLAPALHAQDPLWVARSTSDSYLGLDARGVALASGPADSVYVLAEVSNGYDTDFLTLKYDAAGTLLWTRRYDSGAGDYPAALAVDAAGRVCVSGRSVAPPGGARTLVYEADGTQAWSALDAGAGAVAVSWGPGGSVYVAGVLANGAFGDFWVARYDALGVEQWSSSWGAPSQTESLAALAVDAAGNAYVTGYRIVPRDAVTLRFDATGALAWVAAYDGGAYDAGVDLAVDAEAVFVTARAGNSPYDIAVLRYDAATGAQQWLRRYDAGDNDEPAALTLDPFGNVIVTGKSYLSGGGYDYLTLEHAPDGTLLWSARFDDTWGLPSDVASDAAGNVYVAGTSLAGGTGQNYRLVKYSPGGAQLWTAAYDSGAEDWGLALAVSGGDRVIVTGFAGERATTAAFTSGGTNVWAANDPDLGTGDDRFGSGDARRAKRCLALDAGGRVHVTGTSSAGADSQWRTLVYDASGALVWSALGPNGKAYGLAVAAAGDTYVVGTAAGALRLVKYDPGGALLWSASAPATQGYALALDPAGNAYVTGPLASGIGVYKFSAAGALVWSAAYDAPGIADTPIALALDASGNVYVTGSVLDADLFVAGFDALGAPLWSVVYNSGWDDIPSALVIDPGGNVIVAGKASLTQEVLRAPALYSSDFVTLKLTPGGAYAWVRREDFSAVDEAYDLVAGADGSVYVTGQASGGFQTVKYAADGTRQWTASGAAGGVAYALALGADGRVHAAGRVSNGAGADARVVSYDAGGTPRHVSSYDGGHDDIAYALALGGPGAAYVAGLSVGAGPDFVTVAFDVQPPSPPTFLDSPTHAATGWGGAVMGLRWWGARDPALSSGLAGYSLVVDSSAATLPDDVVDVPHVADPHTAASAPLPEGAGYFAHVRACDVARHCSAAIHAGPYGVDLTPPTPPGSLTSPSHTPGVASNDTTVDLSWTPAADALSGLAGYGYAFDANPSAGCDFTSSVGAGAAGASGQPLPAGAWYAHVCARDRAGNASSPATAGPFVINAVADVEVTLSAAPDPAAVHGPFTCSLKVNNLGPSTAPGVTLVFTPAAGLELLSTTPGPPACTAVSGKVYCILGDLARGATPEAAMVVRATTPGAFTSSVRVSLGRGAVDLAPDNDVAETTTEVRVFKGDLDHDAAVDLLLRHDPSGEHRLWRMSGTTRLEALPLVPATAAPGWTLRGVDDFDGDRRDDLAFWNAATGTVEFWRMDGAQRLGAPVPLTGAPALAPNWHLVATGDFNHDGHADLLWRNVDSQKLVVWTLAGTSRLGVIVPQPDHAPDGNWEIVGARDFDRDGNVDLLWWNRVSGRVVEWLLDANVSVVAGRFTVPDGAGDANWQVVAVGDYGLGAGGEPGSDDIVWRNVSSGRLVVWHMNAAGARTSSVFVNPPAPPEPATEWSVVGPR